MAKESIGKLLKKIRPKEIANKALRNTRKQSGVARLSVHAGSVENAIDMAFVWACSPEGHDFWSKIQDKEIEKHGQNISR